jgi:hypothetical protein
VHGEELICCRRVCFGTAPAGGRERATVSTAAWLLATTTAATITSTPRPGAGSGRGASGLYYGWGSRWLGVLAQA